MQLSHFEDDIDGVILARGEAYASDGLVRDVAHIGRRFSAIVYGTEEYSVGLSIDNDEIDSWSCTCPYARGGSMCKHIVALLFVVRGDRKEGAADMSVVDLEGEVRRLSREALESLLVTTTPRDKIVAEMAPVSVATQTSGDILPSRREGVRISKSCLDKYKRKNHYYGISDDAVEGAQMVFDWAEDCEEENPARAIGYYFAVIETLVPALQWFDDSNAELGDPIRASWEGLFRVVARGMSESIRAQMLAHILKEVLRDIYDGWDEPWEFLRLGAEVVAESEEAKLLACINARANNSNNSERSGTEIAHTMRTFDEERVTEIRLRILERLYPHKVSAFMKENVRIPSIRARMILCAINDGDLASARVLADGGVMQGKKDKHLGTVNRFQKVLLDIALQEDDRESIRAIVEIFATDGRDDDLMFYKLLKKYTPPGEWEKIRMRVLSKMMPYERERVFIDEQAVDELVKLGSKDPDVILRNARLISRAHKGAIVKACKHKAMRDIVSAGGTAGHRLIVDLLIQMKEMGAGKEAEGIVREWRTVYKQRRSLVSELTRAGF